VHHEVALEELLGSGERAPVFQMRSTSPFVVEAEGNP